MMWMTPGPKQHSVSLYTTRSHRVRAVLQHCQDLNQVMDTLGAPTPRNEAFVSIAWDFLAPR
jgi:hypothetical protein